MNRSAHRRRASASVNWGADRSAIAWVGARPLHAYWSVLAPYFRDVLLPPQRHPDESVVTWTWAALAEEAVASSRAEYAALRRRLQKDQALLVEYLDSPGEGRGLLAAAQQDRLGDVMAECVQRLVALSDAQLAAYVAITEAGWRLHSWGAGVAATVEYPSGAPGGAVAGGGNAGSDPAPAGGSVEDPEPVPGADPGSGRRRRLWPWLLGLASAAGLGAWLFVAGVSQPAERAGGRHEAAADFGGKRENRDGRRELVYARENAATRDAAASIGPWDPPSVTGMGSEGRRGPDGEPRPAVEAETRGAGAPRPPRPQEIAGQGIDSLREEFASRTQVPGGHAASAGPAASSAGPAPAAIGPTASSAAGGVSAAGGAGGGVSALSPGSGGGTGVSPASAMPANPGNRSSAGNPAAPQAQREANPPPERSDDSRPHPTRPQFRPLRAASDPSDARQVAAEQPAGRPRVSDAATDLPEEDRKPALAASDRGAAAVAGTEAARRAEQRSSGSVAHAPTEHGAELSSDQVAPDAVSSRSAAPAGRADHPASGLARTWNVRVTRQGVQPVWDRILPTVPLPEPRGGTAKPYPSSADLPIESTCPPALASGEVGIGLILDHGGSHPPRSWRWRRPLPGPGTAPKSREEVDSLRLGTEGRTASVAWIRMPPAGEVAELVEAPAEVLVARVRWEPDGRLQVEAREEMRVWCRLIATVAKPEGAIPPAPVHLEWHRRSGAPVPPTWAQGGQAGDGAGRWLDLPLPAAEASLRGVLAAGDPASGWGHVVEIAAQLLPAEPTPPAHLTRARP